ncbi:MAG: Methyltransferase type 12 [Parcubacteria group bacterium GW2011_GWB1_57_6]|nr:MAG: Methyltransferase type 12 [Parcubacteria group bacterium GW2011_GWA1_56_13]KKW46316.1 MAG: Methyltransferase type 12 [Parcubacteria group bacterium GW2011_GWB1_57_6]
MSKEQDALLVLYEQSHADLATSGTRVACLNFWLEQELKSRGIACLSLGDCPSDGVRTAELVNATRAAAREWYRLPAMNFFMHKGIPIGEAFEPMVDTYLGRLAYWRYSSTRILDAVPETTELIIPHSTVEISATAGPLAHFEVRAAVDAARSLATERGLAFRTLGDASRPPARHVYPRSRLQETIVAFYNFCIGFAPRRPLKIFASEYWRNIAPFITRMDDAELVLMERGEFKNIPWRQLWGHRIRFMHPRAVARGTCRAAARSATEGFRAAWPAARLALKDWEGWKRADIPWAVVEPALEYLVGTYAERIVADMEGLERIVVRERPDKVLLRASVGGRQPHFFLAARVARRLGIPSIELQHAGAYVDPRSVLSRLETDYLAAYGSHEREFYEQNGYAPERIILVGSPRFDRCIAERLQAQAHGTRLLQEAGLDPARPVLLAAVPDEGVGFGIDSFMLADFFRAVASIPARTPGLQVVFKFRPGNREQASRDFARSLVPDAVCMATEDLFSLICASDIAICGNSTVIYEVLIAGKPLLLHPWRKDDTYHARMYAPAAPILYAAAELAEAVARALSDDAYRRELIARGRDFLQGYSFDGKSAQRMASLLHNNLACVPSGIVAL